MRFAAFKEGALASVELLFSIRKASIPGRVVITNKTIYIEKSVIKARPDGTLEEILNGVMRTIEAWRPPPEAILIPEPTTAIGGPF
ncbi:hypothetical protein Nans01_42990 [Nocardiopsis ansamitocini]|uniref:Uncharacterized protein n=1 Tax=Nocardiopsis ansamitocini TaxID=1670832 RepID=A0A9W6PAE5_9ACTN|nr:hypothetical protein Nans01_42990 [Nocardiopsis ansamitocini]